MRTLRNVLAPGLRDPARPDLFDELAPWLLITIAVVATVVAVTLAGLPGAILGLMAWLEGGAGYLRVNRLRGM